MMTTQELNSQPNSIHILTSGHFGKAVAFVLKEFFPDILETCLDADGEALPDILPVVQLRIVAVWRPASQLCHLLNERSYISKTPFIPVIMIGSHIQIGPVIVPGVGTCYSCYEKRLFQHSLTPSLQRDLYHHYDNHTISGPEGYLAPFAEIAATYLALTIQKLNCDAMTVAGSIWQWNTLNFESVKSVVIGTHDCPYCGLQRDKTLQSFEKMRQALSHLFAWNGDAPCQENDIPSAKPRREHESIIDIATIDAKA